jgi:uracil-DNA glycosylase
VTADDLESAFANLPAAWAEALPGWTAERRSEVIANIRRASGDRAIAPDDPFRALRLCAPEAVKVVVFGQDPYPKPGQADGLAFSAGAGRPASLRRIFQVLAADRPGFAPPAVWKLDAWAQQGVLLLNPTLTIEVGRIGSHLDCGWQALTSQIVQVLCRFADPPVFLLWGEKSQRFFEQALRAGTAPQVLKTRHPSNDMQRRFMAAGSHFLRTSDLVDWWAI